jgi:hypothetical protein
MYRFYSPVIDDLTWIFGSLFMLEVKLECIWSDDLVNETTLSVFVKLIFTLFYFQKFVNLATTP